VPFALLGLHIVAALAAPALARRLGRRVFAVCGLAPLASTVWAIFQASPLLGGRALTSTFAWAPSLGLTADLRLDAFALLMVLIVSGIGTIIFAYASAYFDESMPGIGRLAGALTGFAGAMLGLVLADNIVLLFVFWELTSVTSFLLIGTKDLQAGSRAAAVQALLTTGAGGLVLLAGLVVLAQAAGTYSVSQILADPPTGAAVGWGIVLVLIGAFTKSAQAPFHAWLPSAMVAPTPVSAYLHSATMVKAGVYLVARLAPAFAVVAVWRPLAVAVGVVTMLLGAYRALRQHDLKLLLAYSTISQLGFMVVLFGIGTAEGAFAGCLLLAAHAVFKAALFMTVGTVDVQTGTRDLTELSGLRRTLPLTAAAALVAAASMAGLPPVFGFIAKEAALEGLLGSGLGLVGSLAVGGVVAGSALTVAYSARFLLGGFGAKPSRADTHIQRPATALLAGPAVLLGGVTLAAGLVPALGSDLVNAATAAMHPGWKDHPLALWHGLNPALALSLLVILAGALLFVLRGRVERLQSRAPVFLSAKEAYDQTVRGLLVVARRTTGIAQNGSLPVYLVVILLTAVILPLSTMVGRVDLPGLPALATNPLQWALSIIAIVAAVATTAVARRFAAVLLLGAVGYSVAAMFVLAGAPDLALTQMLVETLTLVIFVLVLRHLPSHFGRRAQPIDRLVRGGVAGAVGVGVFLFSLVAAGVRSAAPVSDAHLARSLPEAGGRNVVNVILVDFRALDTLGEITVLVTAALGIVSLVVAGRASRPAEEPDR
jgi:multicomponent Na+:H+ antiporter subunit A